MTSSLHHAEQTLSRRESRLYLRFVLLSTVILTLLGSHLFLNSPVANAGVSDCSGTPSNPIFPGYPSGEELAWVNTSIAGQVLIRHGFYCIPDYVGGGTTPPTWEYDKGFGFGLDKVQNRHHVGRPQDGWSKTDAIKAVGFVLTAEPNRTVSKSDGWGPGWEFTVTAQQGRGCKNGVIAVGNCQQIQQMDVTAASTMGGDDYEPSGGMPAGDPLGLQTVYCRMTPYTELRCPDWVTNAMVAGAGKLDIEYP